MLTPDGAERRQTLKQQAETKIPEVEMPTEVRAVAAVMRELRENHQDALEN